MLKKQKHRHCWKGIKGSHAFLSGFKKKACLPWPGETTEETTFNRRKQCQYERLRRETVDTHSQQNVLRVHADGWLTPCESLGDGVEAAYLGSSRCPRCPWGCSRSGCRSGRPGPPSGGGGACGSRSTPPPVLRRWSAAPGFHGTPGRTTREKKTDTHERWACFSASLPQMIHNRESKAQKHCLCH